MVRNSPPEVKEVAAIEIQRFWRGYRVRNKLRSLIEELLKELRSNSRTEVQSSSKADLHADDTAPEPGPTQFQPPVPSSQPPSSQPSSSQTPSSHTPSSQTQEERQDITELDAAQQKKRRKTHRFQSPAAGPGTQKEKRAERHTEKPSRPQQPDIALKLWPIRQGPTTVTAKEKGGGRLPWLSGERKREVRDRDDLREASPKRQKMTKKTPSRLTLEASYDRYVQKALETGEESASMLQFMEYCAYRIQTCWLLKHHKFMRERFIQRLVDLQKKAALESAAVMEAMIQEASKNAPKKKREGPPTEREAAISIQRAWRRHIDIQVYRYYRDLINFKTRGNPAVMLRCINPNEAKLLDPASGTSVRFRLAGDRFPPNIYYKIFTHRPVQDMCANSPKDYTKAQAKQLNVRHRHNKVAAIPPQQDDKSGWYQRFENNGWRLVSDRLIHHILNDPITWESSKKTYQFDHSKLKRKQDVEKQKKTRKIEWMKKMYKQGMLRARADDHETVQLIEGAAAGMMATVDNQGPEALEDWEVDELLDWTTSLNFEEYFSTWKDLATSAAADNQMEKTMSIGTSKSDPYELTVSTAPSRFQSTRQSRHTTATLTSGSIHVKT